MEKIEIFGKKYNVNFEKEVRGKILKDGEHGWFTHCVIRHGSEIFSGIAIEDPKDYRSNNELTGQRIAFHRAAEAAVSAEIFNLAKKHFVIDLLTMNKIKVAMVRKLWHDLRFARYALAKQESAVKVEEDAEVTA